MEQPRWLERAKETYKFHRSKLLANDKWNTTLTAKSLRRSIGSVSEDLTIARFCKDNEKEIEKMKYAYEALDYIREKDREEEREEV